MFELYTGNLAPQVTEDRHAEWLAVAEIEQRTAPGVPRSPSWGQRVLAGLGARLIAMGQQLARPGDAHHLDTDQIPRAEEVPATVAQDWGQV